MYIASEEHKEEIRKAQEENDKMKYAPYSSLREYWEAIPTINRTTNKTRRLQYACGLSGRVNPIDDDITIKENIYKE